MNRRHLLLFAVAPIAWSAPALALDLPEGEVVLTIGGRIRHPNRGATAVFDIGMLERLPQTAMTLRTPWFDQARKFSGPLLRDVIAAAGGEGQQLSVAALNDYHVDIPIDDIQRFDVVLATRLDDKPMSVREKGPLFIIYPFDRDPALRNSVYYSRCAWQLKSIEVR
jgi:hypothetical protein